MMHYRAGDMVYHGTRRGEVVIAAPCGWSGQICAVRFGNLEQWIMADELKLLVERLRFKPRIVAGIDFNDDTLPSEVKR